MSSEDKRLNATNSFEQDKEYERHFDSYRPKFVGIPEGEYPNSWGHVIMIWCLFVLLYIVCGAVFALFLWLLFIDTFVVNWVYAGLGLLYAAIIITAIFYGQTIRGGLEKKYMQEALEHHAKVVNQNQM